MDLQFDNVQTWEEFASTLPRNASDTDKLLAAICYKVETENANEADISEIANHYFRRARWARPVNLSATANYCASKGWLSEAGHSKNRKVWKLTKHGYTTIKARTTIS
jgi:hypothetical protein